MHLVLRRDSESHSSAGRSGQVSREALVLVGEALEALGGARRAPGQKEPD